VADFDVITLGETMLRLSPTNLRRIEQANELEIYIGGTESNTAVGLARLGLKVCWLSRLTDNPLGRLLAGKIAQHGVDTSHVTWTDEDRIGLLFLEEGKAPRGSRVIYDRQGSAASRLQAGDLPRRLFHPAGARLFHTTGITVAIGKEPAAATAEAVRWAKEAGWLVSFDLNYRSTLWSPAAARRGCDPIMQQADILFLPERDAILLYELAPDTPPEDVLRAIAERYPRALIALTLGADGAIARAPGGEIHRQASYPAEEVDRIGGGDAFSAGFLYGYLSEQDDPSRLATALRWGAAAAALKYGIRGDFPVITRSEIEALIEGATGTGVVR
jgi:2-dehydro-3-deoxygluconokinase